MSVEQICRRQRYKLSTRASGCSSGGRLGALLVSRNSSSFMLTLLKEQQKLKQRQTYTLKIVA